MKFLRRLVVGLIEVIATPIQRTWIEITRSWPDFVRGSIPLHAEGTGWNVPIMIMLIHSIRCPLSEDMD